MSAAAFCALALGGVPSAGAQGAGQPLAQLSCQGAGGGVALQGQVLAELLSYQGGGMRETSSLTPAFMRGELNQLPGTVALYGNLIDSYRNLISFEVLLTGVNSGTGSYWVNHARHRETYMQLLWAGGGAIRIQTEDGVSAQLQCQQAG